MSPYGKSAGTAPRYKNLFNMLGMGMSILALLNLKHLIQHTGAHMDTLSVILTCVALLIVRVILQ